MQRESESSFLSLKHGTDDFPSRAARGGKTIRTCAPGDGADQVRQHSSGLTQARAESEDASFHRGSKATTALDGSLSSRSRRQKSSKALAACCTHTWGSMQNLETATDTCGASVVEPQSRVHCKVSKPENGFPRFCGAASKQSSCKHTVLKGIREHAEARIIPGTGS